MHTVGFFNGAARRENGDLVVQYTIPCSQDNLDELDEQKTKKLEITIKKFVAHKTLNQNDYFWALVGEIALALKIKPWDVYLMLLEDTGNFYELKVTRDKIKDLKNKYRLIKEIYSEVNDYDGIESVTLHCYFGCSSYTTREMAQLIDTAVQQARSIGLKVVTPEEFRKAGQEWKPQT